MYSGGCQIRPQYRPSPIFELLRMCLFDYKKVGRLVIGLNNSLKALNRAQQIVVEDQLGIQYGYTLSQCT